MKILQKKSLFCKLCGNDTNLFSQNLSRRDDPNDSILNGVDSNDSMTSPILNGPNLISKKNIGISLAKSINQL